MNENQSIAQIDADLARGIANSFIAAAVADGRLDPRGKSKAQYNKEVARYLKHIAFTDVPLHFTDDHRSSLLHQAQEAKRRKDFEEATLFYATWIEHMVNLMVASTFRRTNFSQKTIRTFIQETGLRAKYIFLIREFTDREPSKLWIDRIGNLSEKRNQFIHFKWIYYDDEQWDSQADAYKAALSKAEAIVRHFRRLEAKYINYK